jgi:hypothetical protein
VREGVPARRILPEHKLPGTVEGVDIINGELLAPHTPTGVKKSAIIRSGARGPVRGSAIEWVRRVRLNHRVVAALGEHPTKVDRTSRGSGITAGGVQKSAIGRCGAGKPATAIDGKKARGEIARPAAGRGALQKCAFLHKNRRPRRNRNRSTGAACHREERKIGGGDRRRATAR